VILFDLADKVRMLYDDPLRFTLQDLVFHMCHLQIIEAPLRKTAPHRLPDHCLVDFWALKL